jgi:hypothetical protein
MSRFTRSAALAAAVAACAGTATIVGTAGAASQGKSTSGKFYIGINPQVKTGIEYVAGQGVDKVLGPDAITFTIKPLPGTSGKILAKAIKVTLWTSGGTLTGTGSAMLDITNSPKAGDATASGGVVSLTKGTGALKGHSFKATFAGSGNIGTGEYVFSYKGTVK